MTDLLGTPETRCPSIRPDAALKYRVAPIDAAKRAGLPRSRGRCSPEALARGRRSRHTPMPARATTADWTHCAGRGGAARADPVVPRAQIAASTAARGRPWPMPLQPSAGGQAGACTEFLRASSAEAARELGL